MMNQDNDFKIANQIRIRKIRIENFKSIKKLDLVLANDKQILIGQNNAGKSNLLHALDCVFNWAYPISESDIHTNIKDGEFTYIDVMLIPFLDDFSPEWYSVFDGRFERNEFGERSFSIRCVISKNENTDRYEVERFPFLDWNSKDFKNDRGYRFTKNFRKCVTSFYITSSRDIISELRFKNSNFSSLLRDSNFVLGESDRKEIEKELSIINELIVAKMPEISDIENRLSNISTTIDGSEKISILPIPNKLNDLDKGVEILIKNKGIELPINMYGDGTRSWMSILTLNAFVELRKTQNYQEGLPFFPIVLIEEPEAHLHSQAQKKILTQLLGIDCHLMVTTHSSDILSNASDLEIIRLFKDEYETSFVKVAENENHIDKFIFQVKNLIIPYHTELLFSEITILVEGMSDKIFLENYFEYKTNKKVHEMGISVINVNGAGNLGTFRAFCEAFRVKNYILADRDKKNEVEQNIIKNNLENTNLYFTNNLELEDDMFLENKNVIISMFLEETSVNYQHKQALKKSHDLDDKALKYLKENKDKHPYLIKKYYNNDSNKCFQLSILETLLRIILNENRGENNGNNNIATTNS